MFFNMATPKAHALAVVDDIAIGIVALLLLAAAGVVFTPQISSDIGAIGSSFRTHMYQWGTSAEKLDEVEEFFGGLTLYNPGGSDDGDEDPRYQVRLARGILAGITSWIASVVLAGKIGVETNASDGYAYYNGYLFPVIPTHSSYTDPYIFYSSYDDLYFLYLTNGTCSEEDSGTFFISGSSFGYYKYVLSNNAWVLHNSDSKLSSINVTGHKNHYVETYDKMVYVWSSVDVGITGSEGISYYGSQPSLVGEEDISSSAVISDLPDQIQSGEVSADELALPDALDYGSLMQDGQTLEQSVINTMAQLSSGTMSHEEFLGKAITAEFPVFTQNLPITPTMSCEYSVGESADTFFVEAVGNSDGSGTLLYEWLDTSTVPYTVIGTGQSFTPDTSKATSFSLVCRVTNTVPCSFVETGYVTSASYSNTYHISVVDGVTDTPGSDTETEEDEKLGIISGTLDRIESLLNPDTDSLTDSSQALQDSTDILNSFEQTQLDGLQNNKHVITDAFKIFGEGSTLLSAFNLVTYIVNGTYNSLGSYQVVITLPVVLGIFLFICSRVRGFDRPRKNNPGYRSSQAKASAVAGGNDPKSPEV